MGKRARTTKSSNKASAATRTRRRAVAPFVEVQGGKIEAIPIEDIDLDGDDAELFRYRVNLRVGRLAKSIKEEGQQIPVILRRPFGSGKLQVVSGFRRINAIKSLGWETVNAIVRGDIDDDVDACKVSILENELRATYNDVDRAFAMVAYRELGRTHEEIEQLFKIGARQRQRLQEITTFPESLQEAIADEDSAMDSTKAVRLMQHMRKHPKSDIDAWIKRVEDQRMTLAQLNRALRESVAEQRAAGPIEFYVRRNKRGRESLRIRPIKVDETLTAEQRGALLKDLKAVIEFVEELR